MIIYKRKKKQLVIPCGLGPVVCEDANYELQMKQVDSSTVTQNVEPDDGIYGLYRVIVNPYTVEWKNRTVTENGTYVITPENADAISGVNFTVEVDDTPELQGKTVDSSTVTQNVEPDEGYDGLSNVTVNPYTLESRSDTLTENGQYVYTADNADGLDQVTIDVSIDTVNNQSKTVNSSTSSQTVMPDEGYTGLDEVTVNPYTLETKSQVITVNGEYTISPSEADGLSSVDISVNIADTPAVVQEKTADSSTVSQTVTPDEGYDGLSSVTINPYTLDTKTVDSSTVSQTVISDEDGLSSVTVNPYTVESKSDTLTSNGQYVFTPDNADALSQVTVDVSIDTVNNQSKTVNSSTSSQTVSPDQGYTGLDTVTVNPYVLDTKTVDASTVQQVVTSDEDGLSSVTVNPYTLDTKTVDASTVQQVVTSDEDGLSSVTVNPYTLESKSDTLTSNGQYVFMPDNADGLEQVTVDVSINTVNNQSKTVNSSTSSQTVSPDQGYTGLDTVTVNPYVLDSKTVNSSTSSQTVVSDEDGLSSVTVNPYTVESQSETLTANGQYVFTPDNADALSQVTVDVSINTVNNQSKTVNSSTDMQYVVPDQGYTGLDYVAVNPYTLDSKTVNSSTSSQTVVSDEDGLSSVTVNPYTVESKSDTLTVNGQYVFTPDNADALSQVTVDVSINTVNNQSKTANSSTSSQVITPDNGYTGLSDVTINPYTLDSKTVDSSTVQQVVTSDEDGLSSVTVNPYTLQEKEITFNSCFSYSNISENNNIEITADASYDGLSSAKIDMVPATIDLYGIADHFIIKQDSDGPHLARIRFGDTSLYDRDATEGVKIERYVRDINLWSVILQDKAVDPSTTEQVITCDPYDSSLLREWSRNGETSVGYLQERYQGLNKVIINPVTAAIDSDIQPENIKVGVQILGVTGSYAGQEINNQSKTVDSSTSSQVIMPDNGYTGLSDVTINPYTVESKSDTLTNNGQYVFTPTSADALSQVTVDVSINTVNNQSKTVNSSTSSQTVTPDQGYTGLDTVTVNPYTTTALTVDASRASITYEPSTADAFSQVTVNAAVLQNRRVDASTVELDISRTSTSLYYGLQHVYINPVTASIDSNIQAGNIKDGVTILGVTGTFEGGTLGAKTVNSSTSSQTVTPDSGDYGLSSVTVNPYTVESVTVNASTSEQTITSTNADAISSVTVNAAMLQNRTVDPSTAQIQVSRTGSSYYGLRTVTVNAVTSSIDSNIQAGNIKDGVTILGVTGTFEGTVINNQSKTVDSSTVSQDVTPDSGYTGLGKVTVNPYILQSKTIQNGSWNYRSNLTVTPDSSYNGLSEVKVIGAVTPATTRTFNPTTSDVTYNPNDYGYDFWRTVKVTGVTASIDSNIAAGNIKDGVTILGVTGNYQGGTLGAKTVNSSTSSQTVTPDSGDYGLSSVTINPYTLDSKTVDCSTGQQVITSDADGLSSVTVNAASLQGRTYTPSTTTQTIYPNSSYIGFRSVTINGVTSSIDANIQSGNIKNGVSILGVTGTFEGDIDYDSIYNALIQI